MFLHSFYILHWLCSLNAVEIPTLQTAGVEGHPDLVILPSGHT